MLYLIGLGLGNEKDLSLNALEILKKCKYIYLENYTSNIGFNIEDLEKLINNKITIADRNLVENKAEEILKKATNYETAILIKGDIFSAGCMVAIASLYVAVTLHGSPRARGKGVILSW